MGADVNRSLQRWLRRWWSGVTGAKAPRKVEVVDVVKRLPQTHIDAAQRLVDFNTLSTHQHKQREIRATREGAHPDIVRWYRNMQKDLQQRGFPFYAHQFVRGREEQERLKRQGRSRANFGRSAHNFGCAVDLVHSTRYWDLQPLEWAVVGAIGKEVARRMGLKLVWGGDWNFYDPAHWELANWRDYREAEREFEASGLDKPLTDQSYFAALDQIIAAKKKR